MLVKQQICQTLRLDLLDDLHRVSVTLRRPAVSFSLPQSHGHQSGAATGVVVVGRVSGFGKDSEAKACAKVLCKRSSRILSRRRFGPHRLDSVRAIRAGTGAGLSQRLDHRLSHSKLASRGVAVGSADDTYEGSASGPAAPTCTTNLGRILLAGAKWHAVGLATLPAEVSVSRPFPAFE